MPSNSPGSIRIKCQSHGHKKKRTLFSGGIPFSAAFCAEILAVSSYPARVKPLSAAAALYLPWLFWLKQLKSSFNLGPDLRITLLFESPGQESFSQLEAIAAENLGKITRLSSRADVNRQHADEIRRIPALYVQVDDGKAEPSAR